MLPGAQSPGQTDTASGSASNTPQPFEFAFGFRDVAHDLFNMKEVPPLGEGDPAVDTEAGVEEVRIGEAGVR